jgi:hypothetical protein
MSTRRSRRDKEDRDEVATPLPAADAGAESSPPWEQIENGRYMPRRIRGSCRGRELG